MRIESLQELHKVEKNGFQFLETLIFYQYSSPILQTIFLNFI